MGAPYLCFNLAKNHQTKTFHSEDGLSQRGWQSFSSIYDIFRFDAQVLLRETIKRRFCARSPLSRKVRLTAGVFVCLFSCSHTVRSQIIIFTGTTGSMSHKVVNPTNASGDTDAIVQIRVTRGEALTAKDSGGSSISFLRSHSILNWFGCSLPPSFLTSTREEGEVAPKFVYHRTSAGPFLSLAYHHFHTPWYS